MAFQRPTELTPAVHWGRNDLWPGNKVMRKPMDTTELAVLMARLGDEGPSELAKRLRVDRTTAWRWISGESPMGQAYAALYRVMAARRQKKSVSARPPSP